MKSLFLMFGAIVTIQLGKFFLITSHILIGFIISLSGIVLAGIFFYKTTPEIYRKIKSMLKGKH